jgi:hypothetical protein
VRPDPGGARRRSVLRLRSALLVSAGLGFAAAPAAGQQAGYEEGILELVADRLPPLTLIVLIDSAGSVLLPIESVASHLGLDAGTGGRFIEIPQTGSTPARIDTAAHSVRLPTRTLQFAPAEMPRRDGVVYLRAEHLEMLLEAELRVDLATLTVVATRGVPFPAQQRIIAEQRRAMLLARQRWEEQRAALDDVAYEPLSGGAVADWEIVTGSLDPGELTTFRARAGVALLGGDLGAGAALQVGRNVDDHVRDVAFHYHRVFPRGRWVAQLRAGDLLTTGIFGRHLRGVELSSRPFLRSTELSSVLLQPDLPPGWEYEVFQGNQLLGYSVTGSADAVAVPLRAGTTPLQVRMYGPAGEEVVQTLVYQTPVSMLQKGRLEYVVGGGRCDVACDQLAHADVRYGITPLITTGAGFEAVRDTAGTAFRPYLVTSMSTGTRATAELTLMPAAQYSAHVSLFPREGTAAYLRGTLSRSGYGPISVVDDRDRRWNIDADVDQRLRRTLPFSQLRVGVAAAGSGNAFQRLRISSLGAFRSGYVEVRYDHDYTPSHHHLVTTRASVFTPFRARGRTWRPLVGGALGMSAAGVRLLELSTSIQPGPASVISSSIQWSRGTSRPSFNLGYSVRTGHVLAAVRAVSSVTGASSAAMLSGSAALSPAGRLTLHPSARTGYAGVSGTVFVDQDGDGILSAADEAVSDAFLVVGGQRVAADASGRFRAWGLQPYQAIGIAIDSTRTSDPGLTTLHGELLVRPVPNMARHVAVPLVRTRELLGAVVSDDDVPTANLTVEVTNLDSGDVVSTVTFSDGFFYVSRLRPGRYRVAVGDASLAAVHAAPAAGPIDFTITTAGDDIVVELSPLRLRRR